MSYKKGDYGKYHAAQDKVRERSNRNKARRKLKKAGVNVTGKHVDHKDGNPKNNSRKNLRAISPRANRTKQ